MNQQLEMSAARWLAPLVWVVLCLLLAASANAADGRVRVAILPVVVNATEDREYLRDGLADMLASRLGQQEGVAVIRVEDPEQATTKTAEAQAVGQAAGGSWVLYGSFTRFGQGASLDVRCVKVTGEDIGDPRSVFVQAGTIGEIIPRLDNLTKRVAHHVTGGASALPAVASSQAGGSPAAVEDELAALRARVDALEQELYADETAAADAP